MMRFTTRFTAKITPQTSKFPHEMIHKYEQPITFDSIILILVRDKVKPANYVAQTYCDVLYSKILFDAQSFCFSSC